MANRRAGVSKVAPALSMPLGTLLLYARVLVRLTSGGRRGFVLPTEYGLERWQSGLMRWSSGIQKSASLVMPASEARILPSPQFPNSKKQKLSSCPALGLA